MVSHQKKQRHWKHAEQYIKYCHESLGESDEVTIWWRDSPMHTASLSVNTIIKLALIWLWTKYLRAVRRKYASVIIVP